MKNILNHYEINESTMALISIAHSDYCTIVLEQDRKLYVNKKALKLVEAACLEGGSTFDGRRKAVTHHTRARQKVPIPINPRDNTFAFPTHSPNEYQCNWIFYHHVKSIKKHPSLTSTSFITFKNGLEIPMQESEYLLNKQMQRTAVCVLLFSNRVPVMN